MKIFLAGTSLHPRYGGPAYSVSRLALALAEAGVEVGLWAPDGSAINSPIVPDHPKLLRLGSSLASALATFGRPDAIHDNGIWMPHNHAIAREARRQKIPRVVSTRGMLEPWAMKHKRVKKMAGWIAYQKRDLMSASLIHATSAAEASNLDKLGLGPAVFMVPNGIDVPVLVPPDGQQRRAQTALFLGRIYPVKGLPMLIEAWGKVKPPDWKLIIAGPDEAGHLLQVRKLVSKAGLENAVEFPGQVDGAAKGELFSRSDLFILPSHSESFGMSVAEAMSYGLPVLTTTAVPWPVLETQRCGWRVDPQSGPLADGLRVATSTAPADLKAMGVRGRQFVTAHNAWPAIAGELVTIYQSVMTRQTRV